MQFAVVFNYAGSLQIQFHRITATNYAVILVIHPSVNGFIPFPVSATVVRVMLGSDEHWDSPAYFSCYCSEKLTRTVMGMYNVILVFRYKSPQSVNM